MKTSLIMRRREFYGVLVKNAVFKRTEDVEHLPSGLQVML